MIESNEFHALDLNERNTVISAFNQKVPRSSKIDIFSPKFEETKESEENKKMKMDEGLESGKRKVGGLSASSSKMNGKSRTPSGGMDYLRKFGQEHHQREVISDHTQLPPMKQYNGMYNIEERRSCRFTGSVVSFGNGSQILKTSKSTQEVFFEEDEETLRNDC